MSFSLNWRLSGLLSLGLLLAGTGAFAADGTATTAASPRPGHAAIASANFLATDAGLEVLS
jgi:gamma-glutamyltranspeptidase/glutathione hydrolase